MIPNLFQQLAPSFSSRHLPNPNFLFHLPNPIHQNVLFYHPVNQIMVIPIAIKEIFACIKTKFPRGKMFIHGGYVRDSIFGLDPNDCDVLIDVPIKKLTAHMQFQGIVCHMSHHTITNNFGQAEELNLLAFTYKDIKFEFCYKPKISRAILADFNVNSWLADESGRLYSSVPEFGSDPTENIRKENETILQQLTSSFNRQLAPDERKKAANILDKIRAAAEPWNEIALREILRPNNQDETNFITAKTVLAAYQAVLYAQRKQLMNETLYKRFLRARTTEFYRLNPVIIIRAFKILAKFSFNLTPEESILIASAIQQFSYQSTNTVNRAGDDFRMLLHVAKGLSCRDSGLNGQPININFLNWLVNFSYSGKNDGIFWKLFPTLHPLKNLPEYQQFLNWAVTIDKKRGTHLLDILMAPVILAINKKLRRDTTLIPHRLTQRERKTAQANWGNAADLVKDTFPWWLLPHKPYEGWETWNHVEIAQKGLHRFFYFKYTHQQFMSMATTSISSQIAKFRATVEKDPMFEQVLYSTTNSVY